MKNTYIEIDGMKIEAYQDKVYINDVRVRTIEELEFVSSAIIKSLCALVR